MIKLNIGLYGIVSRRLVIYPFSKFNVFVADSRIQNVFLTSWWKIRFSIDVYVVPLLTHSTYFRLGKPPFLVLYPNLHHLLYLLSSLFPTFASNTSTSFFSSQVYANCQRRERLPYSLDRSLHLFHATYFSMIALSRSILQILSLISAVLSA